MKKNIENENTRASGDNYPYKSPAPGEAFPIIASGLYYDDEKENKNWENSISTQLEPLKGAGFNLLKGPAIGFSFITYRLGEAKEKGINVIFWTRNFGIAEYMSEVKKKIPCPGFGGFNIADEPTIPDLLNDSPDIDTNNFLYRYNLITQNFPQELKYINLYPTYTQDGHNYEEYIATYQDNYHPSFFSYDLYPVKEVSSLLFEGSGKDIKGTEGEVIIDRDTFYQKLQEFSGLSKEHERPFWAFCQCMSWMSFAGDYYSPVAKEQYLRYEAFSALAYGAKGLHFWTFSMRKNKDAESYFSALLNRRSKETASWYYAKKVIAEIKGYQNIFLKAKIDSFNIKEFNAFTIPGPIVLNVSISTFNPQGVILSTFKSGDNTYCMVVSKDPLDFQTIGINVNIGKLYELKLVEDELGDLVIKETLMITSDSFSRILPPGGYIIFRHDGVPS